MKTQLALAAIGLLVTAAAIAPADARMYHHPVHRPMHHMMHHPMHRSMHHR